MGNGGNVQATVGLVQAIQVGCRVVDILEALGRLGGKKAFRVGVLEARCIAPELHLLTELILCHRFELLLAE